MEREEYSKLIAKIKQLPDRHVYRNSTPVVTISGTPLTVWDVVKAGVMSNLNMLLIGERGDGKTQLENDVKNCFFDGNATYIRMKDDFRLRDLYEAFNLETLASGQGTTHDARELIQGNVGNGLTIIDEINRAHEKVQNQVFEVFDRYIIFNGKKQRLGVKLDDSGNYHVTLASANIGSERYGGTSSIDDAMLDRAHLILNVNNYQPSAVDTALISLNSKSTGIEDFDDGDHTAELAEVARGVRRIPYSLDSAVTELYLRHGLGFCSRSPDKNKKTVIDGLPTICEGCHDLGEGCGYIRPISIRAFKNLKPLSQALKAVADAKSGREDAPTTTYEEVLSAFELVAPYSGILDTAWVDQQYKGNPKLALDALTGRIRQELRDKEDALTESFNEAVQGRLSASTTRRFNGRWGWYNGVLEEFNVAASKYGDLTKLDKKAIQEVNREYPITRWLSD